MTKQFNYKKATAEDIAAHFLASSRQVISHARNYYKDDKEMWDKVNQGYKLYVLAKIDMHEEETNAA